jgi:peptide-methionine (R)-S-oxide reductase
MDKTTRTVAEWREALTPEEYAVLRQAGTEAPFTGEYTDTKTEGVYRCRARGAELFRSDAKFEDRALGVTRTEVRCASWDSHLRHEVPTDRRWCVNSVSLQLEPTAPTAS